MYLILSSIISFLQPLRFSIIIIVINSPLIPSSAAHVQMDVGSCLGVWATNYLPHLK